MRQILKHTIRIFSVAVVLLTLLAYLCPLINPTTFRWLAFFGTAFPWLLLFNVVLLAVWTWRLNRFALYHLGVIVFGWQYVTGFVGFAVGKNDAPGTAYTVATHNLGGLYRGKRFNTKERESVADAYVAFLQENGVPDILCTQETSGKFYRLVAQKLGYEHTFNLKKGTVILSKFPMEAGGDIPFGKTANSSIWVDVRIGKQLLRVYNLHLQSNSVTQTTEKVIDEHELDEGETWNTIGKVLGKVGNATSLRAEQAGLLREHIEKCPHAVLICGDFNDTPNSYVYATLSNGMKDTFKEAGLGLGTTFGGALPLLRIDYVLTDPKLDCYACRTIHDSAFSDHFPVFVQISF
jgi:endonuclease/exonuclease/phosphatase family metal-dependent hydrolase